jgi:hypothetical protein
MSDEPVRCQAPYDIECAWLFEEMGSAGYDHQVSGTGELKVSIPI